MATIADTLRRFDEVNSLKKTPQALYIKSTLQNAKQLDTIDPLASMHLSLPGNQHLKVNQKLRDEDTETLLDVLHGNSFVTSLDLRYNLITDKGAKHIAQLIKDTSELVHINLDGNDIGEEGAKLIAAALQDNKTVKELRLKSNKIGNAGGMAFAQMLQVNTTLERIDLSDTDQKTESLIALATVLRSNSTLRYIAINRPLLHTHQEEITVHFAKMLKINTSLRGLSLTKYDMRDFGLGQLAENLLDNMSLTYLDLSSNRLTRDGVEALSRVLRNNTMIEHLDLSGNRLECPGAKFLADAIAHYNTNLKTMVVRYNNMKGTGLCCLANALKYNTTLQQMYIWGNVLEEPAAIAFKKLLEDGRLQAGNTDVQPYTVDGVTILAEVNLAPHRFDYWKPVHGDDVPNQLV